MDSDYSSPFSPVSSAGIQAPCCAACPTEAAAGGDGGADRSEDPSSLALYACLAGFSAVALMMLAVLAAHEAILMAVLALATMLYAGQPFFLSALRALRRGRPQMDVPISLALLLTTGLGCFETYRGEPHTYFDSVAMLLFILLVGRYLDVRMRGRARSAAADLLSLFSGTATILEGGAPREISKRALKPGMVLLVSAGEKIAADGEVSLGDSSVDSSIITGETLPQAVGPGAPVFAGMINLSAPIHVRVHAAGQNGLVGEIVRLMQSAEQSRARFVRLADRVAYYYVPVVLGLAAATFLLWAYGFDATPARAFVVAMTVLVMTCPCAMGLAVPAVQVLATSRLFKRGLLVKAADALERLAKIDTIVFDKTGTLTSGKPLLVNRADVSTEELKLAASLAVQSKHPLARAVLAAHGGGPVYALDVAETPSQGLESVLNGETVRLGSRAFCGPTSAPSDGRMEMWLRIGYKPPRRLAFSDMLREDALDVMNELRKKGFNLYLLSGDREDVVEDVAEALGFEFVRANCTPAEKCAAIEALKKQGRRVLMVGDGLNDAAALEAAHVSISPSSALDLTQNAADMVFQGEKLAPVLTALRTARRAHALTAQNIALSVLYNIAAVPVAIMGLVTPSLAAAAMSLSSLTVVLNAQRMRRG